MANFMRRQYLGETGIYGRVILKLILKEIRCEDLELN
jgi:hypothetical protein